MYKLQILTELSNTVLMDCLCKTFYKLSLQCCCWKERCILLTVNTVLENFPLFLVINFSVSLLRNPEKIVFSLSMDSVGFQ